MLSNREKREEYLKLKPKCINCKRPGGTRFTTNFVKETDKSESYRQYIAVCGIIADPCNLDIKIQIGKVELLPNLLDSLQTEITNLKNKVIDDKNKLLFGYSTTEETLEKFDEIKEDISFYTELYGSYIEKYNLLIDNTENKAQLNESITNSYIQIDQIKNCIKKMNETNNVQYAQDAVIIYENELSPLLSKIRSLKYNETMVAHNADSNTCNLIQNRYSIQNLSYSSFISKVVSYNVGLKVGKKKMPAVIIESSEPSTQSDMSQEQINAIPQDEPIYGEGPDGVAWNIPEYKNLWLKLPPKLKNVLKTDHDWMKEFMFNCTNSIYKKQPCKFTTPKNLKIPPEELQNGDYNFGVNIYTDAFKKLDKPLQKIYLTLYSTDPTTGQKNYTQLINTMNDLIMKEVDFNNGIY